MSVRYGNLSEIVRSSIIDDVEVLHYKHRQKRKLDKAIINYFAKIKDANEYFYNNVLGLLMADAYKLLNVKRLNGDLTKDELDDFEKYDNITNATVVLYFEENPYELISALYYMSEFNDNDYFMKRSILDDLKDKAKYLCQLSEFSIYDFLYYCQKYEPDTLKALYNDYINDEYPEDEAMLCLINIVNELHNFDLKNYKELMINLLTKYYVMGKNNLIKSSNFNLVSHLEKDDINDVLRYLNDDDIMGDVLKTCFDYDGDTEKLKVNKKNKTLKKIKKINEIKEI